MLLLHFTIVVAVTVVVSIVLMRRYSGALLKEMQTPSANGMVATNSGTPGHQPPTGPRESDGHAGGAMAAESGTRRTVERRIVGRIAVAYLLTTAVAGAITCAALLRGSDIELSSSRFVALTGAMMGAAVPPIVISCARPFWQGLAAWGGFSWPPPSWQSPFRWFSER